MAGCTRPVLSEADTKTAGIIFYGLPLASSKMSRERELSPPPEPEPEEEESGPSVAQILLDKLREKPEPESDYVQPAPIPTPLSNGE